jgi:hypothetical protein
MHQRTLSAQQASNAGVAPPSKRARQQQVPLSYSPESVGLKGPSKSCRRESRLQIRNFFSDVLYQGHLCATLPIPEGWLQDGTIPRCNKLSVKSFREGFEAPNRPVVFHGGISTARACERWTRDFLENQLSGKFALAGKTRRPL